MPKNSLREVLIRTFVMVTVCAGVGGAGALLYGWRSPIAPITPPTKLVFDPELVRKGALLASIGDCQACHTAPRGRMFAGGFAMATPFGTIYSSNITPDPDTGIGRWSEEAFGRAMREGVRRNGQHLYPAFPYDHFSLTTDEDINALYAFFMSRDPVEAKTPPNELPFPINIRLVLAGWKLLFFHPARFVSNPLRDVAWNRGKYLVEGLGHCGACHTPRNLLGAEEKSRAFEGGEAEGWRAYALGAASQSPVPWDEASLTQYLTEGFHPLHGVARESMAVVTGNLAGVPRQDVAAMAHYLASLSTSDNPRREKTAADARGPGTAPQSAGSQAATPAASADAGSRIYSTTCASCHEGGRAVPLGGIDLSLSTAIGGESPENVVNLVLDGLPAADGIAGPIMPSFAGVLTDQQLADLVSLSSSRRRAQIGLAEPRRGHPRCAVRTASQGNCSKSVHSMRSRCFRSRSTACPAISVRLLIPHCSTCCGTNSA
jgi:mono/diheme cytochrome c family protein